MELGYEGGCWEGYRRGLYSFGEMAAYCDDLGVSFSSRGKDGDFADYGLGGCVEFEEGWDKIGLESD